MLDFSSALLREVNQAQEGPAGDAEMLGRGGDRQGSEDRRSLLVFKWFWEGRSPQGC